MSKEVLYQMECAPSKPLLQNDNDCIVNVMISLESGCPLWYILCFEINLNYYCRNLNRQFTIILSGNILLNWVQKNLEFWRGFSKRYLSNLAKPFVNSAKESHFIKEFVLNCISFFLPTFNTFAKNFNERIT